VIVIGQPTTDKSNTTFKVKPDNNYRHIHFEAATLTVVIVSAFVLIILICFLLYKIYEMVSFCLKIK